MKIFDDKGYKISKELLQAYYEEYDAIEDIRKDLDGRIDKLFEEIEDYEGENGRGDFEAQEKREMQRNTI